MTENSEIMYEIMNVAEVEGKNEAAQGEPAADDPKWEKKDPAHKAGWLLVKASHLMKRARRASFQQQNGGFDPNQGQGRVISLLQKTGPMKQSELVYLLGVRQQSLAETLGKLENLGMIQRERSENDRRTWVVSLTEAGKAAQLNQNEPVDALDGFSDEELKQFSDYLKRVIKNLESQVGDEPCGHGHGHGRGRGHGPGCEDHPRGPQGHGCGGPYDGGPRFHHEPAGFCGPDRRGPHGCGPRGPHRGGPCGPQFGPQGFQRDCHRPW